MTEPADASGGDESPAADLLPLFPLSSVLFPGSPLPLHIFEDRYRTLVSELVSEPEDELRRFGVIAIRSGREAGPHVPDLHEVGCAATIRTVSGYPDGRFDVLSVGTRRFRLLDVDVRSRPYLLGRVQWLGEPVGSMPTIARVLQPVRTEMQTYADQLVATGAAEVDLPELPNEPLELSYLISAALLLPLRERQGLLAAPDSARRLRLLLSLLRRENTLLDQLAAVSAADLIRVPPSPN